MAGFECSTHRRSDGRRLDLVAATRHDEFVRKDYQDLRDIGIGTVREGLRWHLIEAIPGRYDFSSARAQVNGAAELGMEVIWDLFHYGYPDHLDIFHSDFPKQFAQFAAAFAEMHLAETGKAPLVVPINEISFFSWIAGDVGLFHPFARGRGDKLKKQLVSAAVRAIEAVSSAAPETRVIASEPAVSVVARRDEPQFAFEAENYRLAQFQALDMLTGRLMPELGGRPDCLDVVGVNYYPHNQWYFPDREMIALGSPDYRPFSEILTEVYSRYQRPIIVSETGTEDDSRAPWFRYVVEEATKAISLGVDLRGICIYPILNHPGWEDERHCHNGLFDYANENGVRHVHQPLLDEILLSEFSHTPKAVSSNLSEPLLQRPWQRCSS